MKKLITLFSILSMISSISMAQSGSPLTFGDGDDPYLNSIHSYSLNVDLKSNGTTQTHSWSIIPDGSAAIVLSAQGWVTITPATVDGGVETVQIDFQTPDFASGDYVLRYSEIIDGCETIRDYPMTIRSNPFYLDMEANTSECNVKVGNVFNMTTNGATTYKTTLPFKIAMNTVSGFSFTTWEFKGALTLASGITVDIADITVTGAIVVNEGGNVFKVSGLAPGTTSITVNVPVSSLITTQGNVTLALSEAKAIKGAVSTPDNGSGDLNQIILLKKLAGATNITAN